MCKPGTSFVSAKEAATLLETTETRVLMMLKRNELVGMQENDSWLVERSSLQLCAKPMASAIVRPDGCGGGCGGGCNGH